MPTDNIAPLTLSLFPHLTAQCASSMLRISISSQCFWSRCTHNEAEINWQCCVYMLSWLPPGSILPCSSPFPKSKLCMAWTWIVHVLGQSFFFQLMVHLKKQLTFGCILSLLYTHTVITLYFCNQLLPFIHIYLHNPLLYYLEPWLLFNPDWRIVQDGRQTDNASWHSSAWITAETLLAGTETHTGGSPKTAQSCQTCWGTVSLDWLSIHIILYLSSSKKNIKRSSRYGSSLVLDGIQISMWLLQLMMFGMHILRCLV
jgi:hypothetical protein